MIKKIKNHWLFKFPLDKPFSELSLLQKVWWSMWRGPRYTKEEVLEVNKEFLKKWDKRK